MSNINLTAYETEKKSLSFDSTLLVVFLGLVLVLALYGGLLFYKSYLENKILETKDAYSSYQQKFSGDQAKKVVDFQKRLDISTGLVKRGVDTVGILTTVEKNMVPGVSLASYEYNDESKNITLTGETDNYDLVAKQIFSFKKSEDFSGISAGSTTYDTETSKINFTINLQLKNINN